MLRRSLNNGQVAEIVHVDISADVAFGFIITNQYGSKIPAVWNLDGYRLDLNGMTYPVDAYDFKELKHA